MRRRHNGGKRHHQPSHYKKKVTTPTTGIYSGAICFSDNFLHQESPQQRSPPTRISSPFTAIVHLLAAAFNELLRSCSGFDLKMRGRLTLEKVNAAINDMASYAKANAYTREVEAF
ncbi:hypothetical protein Ahy_B06g079965 isoform B [Arachis hypogaea]|uniref:Uncharacterized protein n=1 Tax=Arachis hypogaea TaxID=3818 RepID=A0A444YGU1_ARAHY|nr:hypothetical protein Ahy_B06g079965 isoform B [Arachis hypogaea]